MDFQIQPIAGTRGSKLRRTIVLACASKPYFGPYLRQTGASPLLWTTGLMAPEAYTLKAALDGWMAQEDDQAIRRRAATAYDKYQRCGVSAAMRLFATSD
jgi:phage-related baseplate assembly protein